MNTENIRKEAASQAIKNTIQVVEEALGVKFPRGSTPTESRENMKQILRALYR